MLWFLAYVSMMLAVWGYYLFRDESQAVDETAEMEEAPQPAMMVESQFDRIRRMRELTTAEVPHYIQMAPKEPVSISIPYQLIESIQADILQVLANGLQYMNRRKDRYIWLAATFTVLALFVHALEPKQVYASLPQFRSWSEMQPFYDKPQYNAAVARQVESKEVYQVLFKDYPVDRARFIHEFSSVLAKGEEAQRDKWQEMYLVMGAYHLKKYIGTAPDAEVLEYAHATLDNLKTLHATKEESCQAFLDDRRGQFVKVRSTVGRDNFMRMVKSIPALIVASRTVPQEAPDLNRANQVDRVLSHRIRVNRYHTTGAETCGHTMALLEEALKLPASEASLYLRYALSR